MTQKWEEGPRMEVAGSTIDHYRKQSFIEWEAQPVWVESLYKRFAISGKCFCVNENSDFCESWTPRQIVPTFKHMLGSLALLKK